MHSSSKWINVGWVTKTFKTIHSVNNELTPINIVDAVK